ncbi:MAG: OmpA family protein [Hyphomicrobiaceae bacterium]|nr:MAG: OmpA family protein [Hyphomicrobiaceae bacterium]
MRSLGRILATLQAAAATLVLSGLPLDQSHARSGASLFISPGPSFDRAQQSDRREEAHDAGRLLEAADARLRSGNLASAIEEFEGIIARFPNSPEAVTARRRILEARNLIKSRPANEDIAVVPQKPALAPAPLVSVPLRPPPKPVPAPVIAQRLNEEFKAAVADRVFFARNSAELTAADIPLLRLQANWLLKHKELLLGLEARADDGDTGAIDAALALERGEAVKKVLVKDGVEARRIRVLALGRDRPIALCDKLAFRARQLLDPSAIEAAEACASHNRSVITIIAPDGLVRDPRIAGRIGETDEKSKDASEDSVPVRQ